MQINTDKTQVIFLHVSATYGHHQGHRIIAAEFVLLVISYAATDNRPKHTYERHKLNIYTPSLIYIQPEDGRLKAETGC
jgi:hypothetical protein